MEKSTSVIYVLELNKGKYYIGKTDNPEKRIKDHISGNGAEYTKMFGVVKLLELIPSTDPFDEDKITKSYMAKYGIHNVRGGNYCKIKLSEEERNLLKRDIWGSLGKCVRCGRDGHYIADCKYDYDVYEVLIDKKEEDSESDEESDEDDESDEGSDEEFIMIPEESTGALSSIFNYLGNIVSAYAERKVTRKKTAIQCYKCKKYGHYANNCTNESAGPVGPVKKPKKKFCYNCKRYGHYADVCPNEKRPRCFKCKCLGHYANNCPKK